MLCLSWVLLYIHHTKNATWHTDEMQEVLVFESGRYAEVRYTELHFISCLYPQILLDRGEGMFNTVLSQDPMGYSSSSWKQHKGTS